MNRLKSKDRLDEIMALQWMHSIDLGDGIITPGRSGPPSPLILQVFDTIDFKGKKVLDVGCWDGLWSFEAEKRGAREVYATDDISQRSFHDPRTFACAKRILNSNVKYYPDINIENLMTLPDAEFDIVLFLGVIYHLRDPLRAFAILRNVMNEGGLVVVEGKVLYDFHNPYANFYYSNAHEKDHSNWWVPSVKCLEEWIESSFFRKRNTYCYANKSMKSKIIYLLRRIGRLFSSCSVFAGRALVVAQTFRGKDPRWVFPDLVFKAVDENEYS